MLITESGIPPEVESADEPGLPSRRSTARDDSQYAVITYCRGVRQAIGQSFTMVPRSIALHTQHKEVPGHRL